MTAQIASTAVDARPLPHTRLRWWHEALILGGAMATLLLLTLWQLGEPTFWRDEVLSVGFAKASLGDLLTIVGRDREVADLPNMAVYHLLLHFWLMVGESEARVRLLSVIFGVASVVPVYFIARRLGGWMTSTFAVGIYVLLPYVIHFSQEARAYALAMLVAGSLTWLLLVCVERRSAWLAWLAYGVLAGLGLYVQFFVAFVVAAHALWLLATRQVPSWRGIAAGGIPVLIALAPIPVTIMEFGGAQQWIPPLSLALVAHSLTELVGGVPLLLALSALGVVAVVARPRDVNVWLVAACVLVPILMAAAISVVKPLFIGRFLIVVLPFMAILAACALTALPSRLLRGAAAVALAGLLVLSLPVAYTDLHRQDWRAAGTWMAGQTQAGDRMIVGNAERSISYYLERAGVDALPGTTTADQVLADPSDGRVWLVMTRSLERSGLRQRLADDFDVVLSRKFGDNLRVVLLTPSA